MLKIDFHIIPLLFWGLAVVLTSCSEAEKLSGPAISFAIPAEGYKVEVGKSLSLNPTVINGDNSSYTWEVNGEVVSSAKLYTFTPSKIGNYSLQLKVSNEAGSDNKTILISAFSNLSPYITKVFDYQYGPGQHASLIPADWKGSDFVGQPWIGTKRYTSLGSWGGYIIAGFDHPVKNVEGADFAVFTQPGPSSEPAVVYVMNDTNADGIPNDGEWAEIKGSEYNHPETIHDYQVTYYKPVGNGNVTWKDNKGNNGELKPVFESSSWWWSGYGNKTEVVFNGEKLPNAYKNISTQSDIENWIVIPGLFTSGYAECYNNLD
ncbi:MAG TPA: PKD-like domain-containing protein, partial [Prolixibacteraceae bacterium]